MADEKMDKIIYIDVGTHFGQEYQSIFGSKKYFIEKIIRRMIGFTIRRTGEFLPLGKISDLVSKKRYLRSKRDHFLCFFVEANASVIYHSSVYKDADGVFNCALTGEKKLSIINLYLANSDQLSQGSSILLSKKNVSMTDAVPALGVPAIMFFNSIKHYIENNYIDYSVILRLNCEGVEDDVIYAAHQTFSDRLALVMGSLKDVQGCKGDVAYDALEKFLHLNNLTCIPFSSDINSWINAHNAIYDLCKNGFD